MNFRCHNPIYIPDEMDEVPEYIKDEVQKLINQPKEPEVFDTDAKILQDNFKQLKKFKCTPRIPEIFDKCSQSPKPLETFQKIINKLIIKG